MAVYSTFLARAFDQALYDIGLHRLPVILCVDRAGITGPDGASHHGLYDIAMFTRVPGMTVFAPSSPDELPVAFARALEITDGPVAIRWPRGKGPVAQSAEHVDAITSGMRMQARQHRSGPDACILAAGQTFAAAAEAAELLSAEGVDVSLWDPRVLKPLDRAMVLDAATHPLVVTIEDGVRVGGFGSLVNDALQQLDMPTAPRISQLGTPDAYLPHGTAAELHAELGLDAVGITAAVRKTLRPHHGLRTASAKRPGTGTPSRSANSVVCSAQPSSEPTTETKLTHAPGWPPRLCVRPSVLPCSVTEGICRSGGA